MQAQQPIALIILTLLFHCMCMCVCMYVCKIPIYTPPMSYIHNTYTYTYSSSLVRVLRSNNLSASHLQILRHTLLLRGYTVMVTGRNQQLGSRSRLRGVRERELHSVFETWHHACRGLGSVCWCCARGRGLRSGQDDFEDAQCCLEASLFDSWRELA